MENINRYKVIPRTLVFLFDKDKKKVLLINGSSNKKNFANQYNGIGGHIESGEGILFAAKRELSEEAGIEDPIALMLCGVMMISKGDDVGISVYIFKSTLEKNYVWSSSEGSTEWVLLSEINKLPIVEDLKIILPKIIEWELGHDLIIVNKNITKTGEEEIIFEDFIK